VNCDPNGIRTRVTAVKGRCPRPLDDRVFQRSVMVAPSRKCASGKFRGCDRRLPELNNIRRLHRLRRFGRSTHLRIRGS
jgi:hypothetical protein